MLKAWIIKLRRKPKGVRDQVALMGAGVFTALITTAWLVTLPFRMGDDSESSANVFGSFTDSISGEIKSFRDTLPTPVVIEPAPTTTTDASTTTNEFMINPTVATSASATTTESFLNTDERPIRIATTTSATGTQPRL